MSTQHLRLGSNPFIRNRVTDHSPLDTDVDVPTAYKEQFERILGLVDDVHKNDCSLGAAILGGPGVGKSHLLGRVGRSTKKRQGAVYVYLQNLLASPERMPRHLLRSVISLLGSGLPDRLTRTALFAVVDAAAGTAITKQKGEVDRKRVYSCLQHMAGTRGTSELFSVLAAFWEAATKADHGDAQARELAEAAVAWLGGDPIDTEIAKQLGLRASHDDASIEDDAGILAVLSTIGVLAGSLGSPFVLCVDQIDNLDDDRVRALSSFLHALLDRSKNILVLIAGVQETMTSFVHRQVIATAAWDRLGQFRIQLTGVTPETGSLIVQKRLQALGKRFSSRRDIRAKLEADTLFPLGSLWFQNCVGNALEIRPRDILIWAREAWEQQEALLAKLGDSTWLEGWPHGREAVVLVVPPVVPREDAVDALVQAKLVESVTRHKLEPQALPPDENNLAELTQKLLAKCLHRESQYTLLSFEKPKAARGAKTPRYDLLVHERRKSGREVSTGVVYCTSHHGNGALAAIQRILGDTSPPEHCVLVTDEERRPLHLGKKGAEIYDKLNAQGADRFLHVKLTLEGYAQLDAMSSVLGAAKVGDLEVEHPKGKSSRVAEDEVNESLHRLKTFEKHPLLHEFVTEEGGVSIVPPPLPNGGLDLKVIEELLWKELAFKFAITAREAQVRLCAVTKTADSLQTFASLKKVAMAMHRDGKLHATSQDDDL
ncbi:MAG: BREX system ATP-binding domain-containing protein, partial [Myxococcales bacterium]